MPIVTGERIRRRSTAPGGVIILAVGLGLAIGCGRERTATGIDAPGGTGRESEASGSAGDGRQARPLAAIREGRLSEAFDGYAGPGQAGPGAEELHALGDRLLSHDRRVLGWMAMEASHRIDPHHAASNRVLDDLGRTLNRVAGPEQAGWLDAADQVEHLRAVRGGPALGLLALGVARYGDTPGRERDFLERLGLRPRAGLRAVDGPSGAVKLVARLLMESGRTPEARDLLRPLAETSDPDVEAAWLLSRAALQLGQGELADTMLARADGYGRDGSSPEPSPFVGSRKCAECHAIAYKAEQESSPHARTIYLGKGLKDVPLPEQPVPDPLDPSIRHQFTRESDDRIRLETRDARGQVARAVVAYALGSGEHGITMVSRDEPGGTPRQLRISYYAKGKAWRETKGVNVVPHSPEEFIGLALTEPVLRQCLNCHTTWFRAALPTPEVPEGPEALDRGIGCERCHGPGLNHVRSVETGYAESAIAVTRTSTPRRLLQSCEECHASNGSVEPSDPEFVRFQATTLKFSRCYTATDGAVHCALCHDPHGGLETQASHYETRCLGCHTSTASKADGGLGEHGARACPVNPASGCIDCHMPKIDDPSFQIPFTNHHIRVHPPSRGAPVETKAG